ncbi:MAG: hypothetical protein K8U03_18255 [Planctomycetia bacterium]|nr:hypothetical protein [Planctomycetia bacterium]
MTSEKVLPEATVKLLSSNPQGVFAGSGPKDHLLVTLPDRSVAGLLDRRRREHRQAAVNPIDFVCGKFHVSAHGVLWHHANRSAAESNFCVNRWRVVKKPSHGSRRSRDKRSGTFRTVNSAGPCTFANSSQVSGVATGAPSQLRVEKDATDVEPR